MSVDDVVRDWKKDRRIRVVRTELVKFNKPGFIQKEVEKNILLAAPRTELDTLTELNSLLGELVPFDIDEYKEGAQIWYRSKRFSTRPLFTAGHIGVYKVVAKFFKPPKSRIEVIDPKFDYLASDEPDKVGQLLNSAYLYLFPTVATAENCHVNKVTGTVEHSIEGEAAARYIK